MSQYVIVKFALSNRTEWYGAMTNSAEWVARPTGAIFASTPSRLRELIAVKADRSTAQNPAGFAGFLPMDGDPKAAKAPKAPAPTPTPAATPWMDAARKAGSAQAKAVKAADAPRTVGQTAHWLNLCLDYGFATVAGEMGGDLSKRGKAARTALLSYHESCAHFGKAADPAYGEAVADLCAAIAKRITG